MKITAKPALCPRSSLFFPTRTNDLIEWVSVNSGRLTSWHCAQGAAKKRIETRQAPEPGIPAAVDREKCEGKLFEKSRLNSPSPLPAPRKTNLKHRSHCERIEIRKHSNRSEICFLSYLHLNFIILCRTHEYYYYIRKLYFQENSISIVTESNSFMTEVNKIIFETNCNTTHVIIMRIGYIFL